MPQRGLDLVGEVLPVDGGAAFSDGVVGGVERGERSVAALDHEVGDHAVEGRGVVGTGGAEGEEVLGGLGYGFAEDFELDVAVGGVQLGDGLGLGRASRGAGGALQSQTWR